MVAHNPGELSQTGRVLERVMAEDQVAAEQRMGEEQDQNRERESSPGPGSIPRCSQFG